MGVISASYEATIDARSVDYVLPYGAPEEIAALRASSPLRMKRLSTRDRITMSYRMVRPERFKLPTSWFVVAEMIL